MQVKHQSKLQTLLNRQSLQTLNTNFVYIDSYLKKRANMDTKSTLL